MRLGLFFVASSFCMAAAAPACEADRHEYRAPREQDSRSPCPGLNVLANHGYLPRSGRDIDLEAIHTAVAGGFNWDPLVFNDPVKMVFDFQLSTTSRPNETFHLEDLAAHDRIEFDGSLSRNDFYSGDQLHFDPEIWATMAERLRLYADEDEKIVTVDTAARARAARVKDAMAANSHFNASASQQQGSPGTTALYLATLWDHEAGGAPKKWVKAFFEEERIVFEKANTMKTGMFLFNLTQAVSAVV